MYTKSTGKATFTYPEVNYDQLFPFHLVMDEQRNLLHFGPSLKKLMGDSNYKKFDDLFKLERPDCDLDLFFNDDHFPTQLSIIQSKLPNKLTLTGSFTALPGKEGHLFLCTPWFKSPEEMNQLGLSITDYPSFDTSVSQLHLLRAQESANKDISTLFKRLSSQKEELELLSMIVQKAANAIIILNSHSVIEYANPALSNLLGFAPEEVTGKPIQEIIAEHKSDHELGVALKSVLEGHSSLVETQLSTKLGTALWVNIQIQPLLGYTGIVEKYYLM
ncbi:MAG: PAS domain S-box protein, partial [Flavobacteriales bacterium]